MHGLGVRIVVEDRPVFIPTQAADGNHGRLVILRIAPGPLGVHDSGGDFEAGAFGFTEVALVNETVLTKCLAQQSQMLCGRRRWWSSGDRRSRLPDASGGRVIDLDAAHAVSGDFFPDLEKVGLELLVRVIIGDVWLMVRVSVFEIPAGCGFFHFGRVVEEHPLRKLAGEVVGRHAELHVDVGNAAAGAHGLAPLGHGVVRGDEVFMQAETFVIPPTLLGIEVIFVWLDAEGDGSVFRDAGFVSMFELLNEFGRVVDVGELAERPDTPAAEHGEVIDVRAGVIGGAHGETVAFKALRKARGCGHRGKGCRERARFDPRRSNGRSGLPSKTRATRLAARRRHRIRGSAVHPKRQCGGCPRPGR